MHKLDVFDVLLRHQTGYLRCKFQ